MNRVETSLDPSPLMLARGHIAMIAGLAAGLGLVVWLEGIDLRQCDAPGSLASAATIETLLPAPDGRAGVAHRAAFRGDIASGAALATPAGGTVMTGEPAARRPDPNPDGAPTAGADAHTKAGLSSGAAS